MDRYHLENPGCLTPDELSEDAQLIMETGNQHERNILEELKGSSAELREINQDANSINATRGALSSRVPIVYQAKIEAGNFAGYADFIILDPQTGKYQIWDTKLARSPKPYYAIQLCCYSEMFAEMMGEPMPEKFGIILGADADGICDRIELRIEDFIHYYRHLKDNFLAMQANFDGDMESRPIPDPRADHGRWQSHADAYLDERDHLVRVAGISTGQIKKLNEAGISTLADLAGTSGRSISKMPRETLDRLVHQARLQMETRELRRVDEKAIAKFDILPTEDETGTLVGLGAMPPEHPADVYFDMEGYPLTPGGLEYLFGNTTIDPETGEYEFTDFWAHDRAGERQSFEEFIDWVYARWRANPGMHIYHYASYEVTAVRRLSSLHNTRQDEVDELLRHELFVDLYKIVRRGLRIGEESYSLKKVERIYWPDSRTGLVTMAIGSVVHYARWMHSGEPRDWNESPILKEIRDYNKDDCDSTAELGKWLRKLMAENGIPQASDSKALRSSDQSDIKPLNEVTAARLEVAGKLREKGDDISRVLADLVDFHRREEKPVWWKFFDRADSEAEVLRDDNGCIANVEATGEPVSEMRSLLLEYTFDPAQECKISAGEKKFVSFTHEKFVKLNLFEIDLNLGTLKLKATTKTLQNFGGVFPESGYLIPHEIVPAEPIPTALTAVAESYLENSLNPSATALL
ncbi:MAG: TM0106 family RecB-like putative nuclease, partial [Pyrinomonadaceae bacterium]